MPVDSIGPKPVIGIPAAAFACANTTSLHDGPRHVCSGTLRLKVADSGTSGIPTGWGDGRRHPAATSPTLTVLESSLPKPLCGITAGSLDDDLWNDTSTKLHPHSLPYSPPVAHPGEDRSGANVRSRTAESNRGHHFLQPTPSSTRAETMADNLRSPGGGCNDERALLPDVNTLFPRRLHSSTNPGDHSA